MWRYLPKRLELLLRMVLAFPKLSRMGKTSMGWKREEENQRRRGVEDRRVHLSKPLFKTNYLSQVVVSALIHRAEVVDY